MVASGGVATVDGDGLAEASARAWADPGASLQYGATEGSAELREALERWSAFDREAADAGALIACEPLEESSAATTLQAA